MTCEVSGSQRWIPFAPFYLTLSFELMEQNTDGFLKRFRFQEQIEPQNEQQLIFLAKELKDNLSILNYAYSAEKIIFIYEDESTTDFKESNKVFFQIPVYRKPLSMFLTNYGPLIVLSFLILSIYQSEYDFGARIANIGVLILALISFIPSMRSNIPPVSYVTLSDILLGFNQISTCLVLLCSFIQTYLQWKWQQDFEVQQENFEVSSEFELSRYQKNILKNLSLGFTIGSLICVVIPALILVFIWTLFYFKYQRKFERKNGPNNQVNVIQDRNIDIKKYEFKLKPNVIESQTLRQQEEKLAKLSGNLEVIKEEDEQQVSEKDQNDEYGDENDKLQFEQLNSQLQPTN
ncbi:UNKNOWN [Stylonychia lemnae]|uniref:Uncharacterized protein n=1 Tax=Stylonychia lemnae TaxID=5949 RepID=A0A078AQJ6_STYLE|nr:UNKNOWN [Stylonychia lemnae]|eukprot:CDW83522.1 UNKNOWN [Stylonychia lemnae]